MILQTPDEEYTFVAEAVNLNDVTSDDIARHIVKMAKAARIDLDKSDRIKHETEFVILKGEAIVTHFDRFRSGCGAIIL